MKKLLLIIVAFFCAGCAGTHCIKVGGEKDGFRGDFEYCFDKKESEQEEAPVFIGSTGQTYLALNADEVARVNAIIDENERLKATAEKKEFIPSNAGTPNSRLLSRIRK